MSDSRLATVAMKKPVEVVDPTEGILSSYLDLENSQILWLWERLFEERPETMKLCAAKGIRAKSSTRPCTNGIDAGNFLSHGQETKKLSDWQLWFVTILEEHQDSMSREIVSQFESFRKACLPIDSNSPLSVIGTRRSISGSGNSAALAANKVPPFVLTSESHFISETITPRTSNEQDVISSAAQDFVSKTSGQTKYSKVSKMSKKKLRSGTQTLLTAIDHEEVQGVIDSLNATLQAKSYDYEISHKLALMAPKVDNNHRRLDILMTLVILMNVVCMVVELEWESHNSQLVLGWNSDHDRWKNAELGFLITEHVFNAIFIFEAGIRLRADRLRYFASTLNVIDFILVLSASMQIYILEPSGVSSGGKVTVFKFIRFARFVRVLRIMRMKMFAALRVLIKTCISSIYALFWSMVLLFLIIIISGLFLCALLKTVIQDTEEDHSLRVWIYRHYGSIVRAAYTLFEATLAGCWPQYFRPLIERVSIFFGLFAVAYITIVVFAVIRIITAIFLKETLQVASTDSEMMVNEMRERTQKNAEKLEIVFSALDVEGRGVLNFDQFARIATHKDVKAWLHSFELAVHDVEGLFHLLDDGDGEITYEEFIEGILRLKGQARSLDVVALSRACDKIDEKVQSIDQKLDMLTQITPRMTRRATDSHRLADACTLPIISASISEKKCKV